MRTSRNEKEEEEKKVKLATRYLNAMLRTALIIHKLIRSYSIKTYNVMQRFLL